jgi:hypothetical protein
MPTVIVDIESGSEKRKFLTYTACVVAADIHFKLREPGQDFFFNIPEFVAVCIVNTKKVTPRKFALYNVDGVTCLVIDVITVEPRKKTLFE